ncbi:MAG: hypothetical protein WEC12_00470 [Balneolaceae bacterium]
MLETFYNNFGFAGALISSFVLFIFFIFWIAGLAGICLKNESELKKILRMTIAVLVPLYPFIWMIWEMIVQKRDVQRE